MDAIIFDFDGVVVDSEPVHLKAFQQVLAGRGITLSRQEYYTRYLGLDDRDCFGLILHEHSIEADDEELARLTAAKSSRVQREFRRGIAAQPGAVELIRQAELDALPIAICSGALREEILLAAAAIEVADSFMTIVSAEDVSQGKPSPEGFKLALSRLEQLSGRLLLADKTLVVEDAPPGIQAAKSLGMKVLAVTTSYDRLALGQADWIIDSLAEVTVADLEGRVD